MVQRIVILPINAPYLPCEQESGQIPLRIFLVFFFFFPPNFVPKFSIIGLVYCNAPGFSRMFKTIVQSSECKCLEKYCLMPNNKNY